MEISDVEELARRFWAVQPDPANPNYMVYLESISWLTRRPDLTFDNDIIADCPFQAQLVRDGNHYTLIVDQDWPARSLNACWLFAAIILDDIKTCMTIDSRGYVVTDEPYNHEHHRVLAEMLGLPDPLIKAALAAGLSIEDIAMREECGTDPVLSRLTKMDLATWRNLHPIRPTPQLNRVKVDTVVGSLGLVLAVVLLLAFRLGHPYVVTCGFILQLAVIAVLFRNDTLPIWNKAKGLYRRTVEWFYR